jgi:type VI secretion system protein ImpL
MGKWLGNRKVATTLGFVIMIALVWLVGPYAGLASAETRLLWIFCIMAIWVATLMIGHLLAQRAGALVEALLRRQADDAVLGARPEQRTEVAQLRKQLLAAIETLKTSKLGKVRGKAALYELPWYMVIGHPAAGKSSAIQYSGLTFPFGDNKKGVQGIGGTRNCDWFFSSEGVLLDTAGRYSTQAEDRAEWLAFLKLLKRYRAKAPVNGILVAISLPELEQYKAESFATYARQIRERIHEIEQAFGLRVPIYLVVTKMDLLGGFAQFFEDFSGDEQGAVWGATLSHDQGDGANLEQIVGEQFDLLYRGLAQLGEDKLAHNRGNVRRPALFAFPVEFHGLKEAMCRFVAHLAEHDPYHGRPLLRGVYFTSALQEGLPRIPSANRVANLFGLARDGLDTAQGKAAHSFFLRSLFREVIFPDQYLIGRETKPAVGRARLAGLVAGLGVLAALASAMSWSYISNDKLIETIADERSGARRMADSGQLLARLRALHTLQVRVDQLYQYRKAGHPWQLGFGLYRGEELERRLRREYFAGVRALMLEPVKGSLEKALGELKTEPAPPAGTVPSVNSVVGSAPAGQPTASSGGGRLDVAYNALKTYLMLNQEKRMDAAHLSDQLPRYWKPWLAAQGLGQQDEANALAGQIVAFYVSQIGEADLPLIANDVAQVSNARAVLRASLRRLSAKERVYNELKARANTRYAPVSVAAILNQKDGDILAGSHVVGGAFTRQAWDGYFRNAIAEASKGEIKSDDWVLASSMQDNLASNGDVERNRSELEALYKADYEHEWRSFLQGVAVRDFHDMPAAAAALARLADPQSSPIKLILNRAAAETAWDNPTQLNQTIANARASLLEKTQTLLSPAAPAGSALSGSGSGGVLGEVGTKFAALGKIVGGKDGAAVPLQPYLALLGKAKGHLEQIAAAEEPASGARQLMVATLAGSGSELADALQYVDGTLLASASGEERDTVRPLLVRPLIQTYATLIPPVQQDIDQAWSRDVYGQWRALSSKYPFADSSNEAPMGEIAKLLKPGSGTLAQFEQKYLNGLLQRTGGSYTPRTWANLGIHFNPMLLNSLGQLNSVAGAVLQEGGDTRFELQPIPTPGISEILIEVDGQQLLYRNGPQPWVPVNWPSAGAAQGARIQVVFFNGATVQVVNYPGRMGLMRLLRAGRNARAGEDSAQIAWPVPAGPGHAAATVRVNFRMVSGTNPLMLSSLRHLALPGRISQ